MDKEPIKLVGPVPCRECGDGYLLPLLVPHFKKEGTTFGRMSQEFSHYELYWKCSNYPHCLKEVRE